jgi:hypothetical protein
MSSSDSTRKTADNFWCVRHPCGKFLHETSSDSLTFPVFVAVNALPYENWEEMCDLGFSLGLISKRAVRKHLGKDWQGCDALLKEREASNV